MKKITTIAVATALLVLAACSTENAAPEADAVVVATEEAAPVAEAPAAEAPAAEVTADDAVITVEGATVQPK
jgi:uncharacterized protein YcfL